MWMNEAEIDQAKEVYAERAPDLYPFAKFLADWRDVVNSSSDGWPYWKAGGGAAERLMTLLQQGMNCLRGRGGEMPTVDQLRKTLTPIRSLATKHNLTAPTLADGVKPQPERRPEPTLIVNITAADGELLEQVRITEGGDPVGLSRRVAAVLERNFDSALGEEPEPAPAPRR
jgi:hypothetical protein